MTGADFKMWVLIGLAYLVFLFVAGGVLHLLNKNESNDNAGCGLVFWPPIAFYGYFLWRGWDDNEHLAMLLGSPILPALACTITTLLVLACAKSWQSEEKKLQNSSLGGAIFIVGIGAFFLGEYADKTVEEFANAKSEVSTTAAVAPSAVLYRGFVAAKAAGNQETAANYAQLIRTHHPNSQESRQLETASPLGRSRNQQNKQYDMMLDQLEYSYPPLNPKSSRFTRAHVAQLEAKIRDYESRGMPGPIALQRAAHDLTGIQLLIPQTSDATTSSPFTSSRETTPSPSNNKRRESVQEKSQNEEAKQRVLENTPEM